MVHCTCAVLGDRRIGRTAADISERFLRHRVKRRDRPGGRGSRRNRKILGYPRECTEEIKLLHQRDIHRRNTTRTSHRISRQTGMKPSLSIHGTSLFDHLSQVSCLWQPLLSLWTNQSHEIFKQDGKL
ncbi:uncharacterized protein LOC143935507 [Lithobates pipiens]